MKQTDGRSGLRHAGRSCATSQTCARASRARRYALLLRRLPDASSRPTPSDISRNPPGKAPTSPPPPQRRVRSYTCPMHPEVLQDGPGDCPKCGMALVPMGGAGGGRRHRAARSEAAACGSAPRSRCRCSCWRWRRWSDSMNRWAWNRGCAAGSSSRWARRSCCGSAGRSCASSGFRSRAGTSTCTR